MAILCIPTLLNVLNVLSDRNTRNMIVHVAILFISLIIFLMLILFLRINTASGTLNAFIFVSQVITQPPFVREFIVALYLISLIFPLILITFYNLRNSKLKALYQHIVDRKSLKITH